MRGFNLNKIVGLYVVFISIIGLVGCGGSVSKKIKENLIEEYAAGIYDISTMSDTLYLSIKNNGLIDTYRLDTDSNCYKKNEVPGLNSTINGRTLGIDYEDSAFEIDSIQWYFGSSKKVSEVRISNIKSSGILESNNIRIASSNHLTSNVTLGELDQSICF